MNPQKNNQQSNIASRPLLYVATDLESFEAQLSDRLADDFTFGIADHPKVYRKLDPVYYLWLRTQVKRAKEYAASGKIDIHGYQNLLARFELIHIWAVENLSRESIARALKSGLPKDYLPPKAKRDIQHEQFRKPVFSIHQFPLFEEGFVEQVTEASLAKVNKIKSRALSLGWSERLLFGNVGRFRFPCGPGYGLVCFLEDSRRIGEITDKFIEIIHDNGVANRFYNPEVDHPWITRKATA